MWNIYYNEISNNYSFYEYKKQLFFKFLLQIII